MADYNVNVKVSEQGTDNVKKKISDLGKELDNAGKKAGPGGFSAGISQAKDKLGAMGIELPSAVTRLGSLSKAFSGTALAAAAVVVAAAAVVAAVTKITLAVAESADKLGKMAERLNMTTERLSLLQVAAKMSGTSLDELMGATERFSTRLAKQDDDAGKVVQALNKLGVSTKNAAGEQKSALLVMEEVVQKAANAKNRHEAEAFAVQALGSDYYKMRGAITGVAAVKGDLYNLMKNNGSIVTAELAKKSADLNDKIDMMKTAFTGMGNSLANAAIPLLDAAASRILKVAQAFAEAMARITGNESESKKMSRQLENAFDAADVARTTPLPGTSMSKALIGAGRVVNRMMGGDDAKFMENARNSPLGQVQVEEMKKREALVEEMKQKAHELHRKLEHVIMEENKKDIEILNGKTGEGPTTAATNLKPADVKRLTSLEVLKMQMEEADRWAKELGELYKQDADMVRKNYEEAAKAAEKYTEVREQQNRAMVEYIRNIEDEHDANTMTRRDWNEMQALRQLEIDHLEAIARLRKDGIWTQERETELILENARARERVLEQTRKAKEGDQDWVGGMKTALLRYEEEANDKFNAARDVATRAFQGMEDALVNFATTGKLNFADLARSIIADLIRIQIRAALSGIFKMIGSSIFGSGDIFSEEPWRFTGNGMPDGFRAAGGPVSAGKTYMVGEDGPEIIRMGGNGTVIPNHALGSGVQIGTISITVQGGQTNEETAAVIHKEMVQTMQKIADGRIANARRPGGLLSHV